MSQALTEYTVHLSEAMVDTLATVLVAMDSDNPTVVAALQALTVATTIADPDLIQITKNNLVTRSRANQKAVEEFRKAEWDRKRKASAKKP